MAYTVPQFRLFQDFAESVSAATSTLSAVIIAPHYGVHQYNEGSNPSFAVDATGAKVQYNEAGLSVKYPNKMVGGRVDTDSVRVYLEDAPAVYNAFTVDGTNVSISGANNNVVNTNTVLHSGNGYTATTEYEVGDYLFFTPFEGVTQKAKILSFIASTEPAVINKPVVNGYTGNGAFSIADGSSYTATKATTYIVIFSDNNAYSIYDTAGIDGVQTGTASSEGIILVGSKGIKLQLPAVAEGSSLAGTIVSIAAEPSKDGGYKSCITDTSFKNTTAGKLELCRFVTLEVPASKFDATEDTITIAPSITINNALVKGGFIAIEYRERLQSFVGKLSSLSSVSDVQDVLGVVSAANPLAAMVYQALLNSNSTEVFFTAVASDDIAGYTAALALLDEHSEVYSIVPYSTDAAIQDTVVAYVDERSSATVMDWKIAWLGCDVEEEVVVLDALNDGSPLTVKFEGSVATVQGICDLTKCAAGDTVTVNTANGVKTFTFDYILSDVTFHIYEETDTTVVGVVSVKHKRSSYEIAKAVADSSARFNNKRVRNLYSNGLYLSHDINSKVSNAYIAAACAGLRSASAPHQPLTRAELLGFVASPDIVFGASLLNEMAEAGTWLVVNDSATVYVRHQLTTDTTNYNLREDSKVTNADEISRSYRDGLSDYYGRANISPEFILVVSAAMDDISRSIATRPYPSTLGPQILNYSASEVSMSETVSDALIAKVTIDTPEPLNYFDVYLTIS